MPAVASRKTALLALSLVLTSAAPALSQDTLWSYSHPYGHAPLSFVHDFSGDGSPDVIFNIPNAPFEVIDTATQSLVFRSPDSSTVWDVHDFDGDGVPDILADTPAPAGTETIDVFSGIDFSLLHRFTFTGIGVVGGMLIDDVTGDGFGDIVVTNYSGTAVSARASEDNRYLWGWSSSWWRSERLPDLDGDGVADVLVPSPSGVFQHTAVSSVTGAVLTEFGALGVPYADEDGDGLVDLLVRSGSLISVLSLADGSTIRSTTDTLTFGSLPTPAGDLNGDGILDLHGFKIGFAAEFLVSGHDLQTLLYTGETGLQPITGDRDFNDDGLADFLSTTGYPTQQTQFRAGNDLWLHSDYWRIAPGRVFQVGIGLGPPGALAMLSAIDVNGVPVFLPLVYQTFGADQAVMIDAVGSAALSGNTVTLMAFGIGLSGGVEGTGSVTLTFL